jgi:hypothetical protein
MKTMTAIITDLKWDKNETLRDEYNRIHKLPEGPFTKFHHGCNGFQSCFVCDEEIYDENPGKRIEYIDHKDQRHVELVCNSCWIEPEYWESTPIQTLIAVTNFNTI